MSDSWAESPSAGNTRRRPLWRRLAGWALRLTGWAGLAFAAGFAAFVFAMPAAPPAPPEADAIAVLTGNDERIPAAISLMGEGRFQRLLISGVDVSVSRESLQRFLDLRPDLFACCIDIGTALDTPGNASELLAWARGHGYRSILLVTSDYHMARAWLELWARNDGLEIKIYATPASFWRGNAWVSDERVWRIMLMEYAKLVAAGLRIAAEQPARAAGF